MLNILFRFKTWWAGLDLNQLTPKRTDLQSAAPHRLCRLPNKLKIRKNTLTSLSTPSVHNILCLCFYAIHKQYFGGPFLEICISGADYRA